MSLTDYLRSGLEKILPEAFKSKITPTSVYICPSIGQTTFTVHVNPPNHLGDEIVYLYDETKKFSVEGVDVSMFTLFEGLAVLKLERADGGPLRYKLKTQEVAGKTIIQGVTVHGSFVNLLDDTTLPHPEN